MKNTGPRSDEKSRESGVPLIGNPLIPVSFSPEPGPKVWLRKALVARFMAAGKRWYVGEICDCRADIEKFKPMLDDYTSCM